MKRSRLRASLTIAGFALLAFVTGMFVFNSLVMPRLIHGVGSEVTVPDFPCRDQRTLFGREIVWVRRCQRSLSECPRPRCMEAIGLKDVLTALDDPQRSRAT